MSVSPIRAVPRPGALAIATLLVILFVYWPLHRAGLVWDDKIYLRETAWLNGAGDWLRLALHGFVDWTNYFRPLAVAILALESKLSGVAPQPMHCFSLGLHLIDTLLVGMLAREMMRARAHPLRQYLPVLAMALYGLHPLLIEPVAWIAGQFDLLATTFMLLGLLLDMRVRSAAARAVAVAGAFLCAAGAKESAVSLPLLLFVLDWMQPAETIASPGRRLIAVLRRQWAVYAAVVAAGLIYLVLRRYGLGQLIAVHSRSTAFSAANLQLAAYTYVTYWKVLLWPMASLAPIHVLDARPFAQFSAVTVCVDIGALAIFTAGILLLLARRPLGALVSGVTCALLPVLHLVGVDFQESYYHDRYALTAVAFAAALLPAVIADSRILRVRLSWATGAGLLATLWVIVAVINIRATLPLWGDETLLWEYTLGRNPGSDVAQDHLLSSYLEAGDLARARPLAQAMLRDAPSCVPCMVKVAYFAVQQGNATQAARALELAREAMDSAPPDRHVMLGYLLTAGNLSQLEGDTDEAMKAYQAAAATDPHDPDARMSIAYLQARQGRSEAAEESAQEALRLCPAGERETRRREFESVLRQARASSAQSTPPTQ